MKTVMVCIGINACEDCPWLYLDEGVEAVCEKNGVKLDYINIVPEDCPLPDLLER